jgi:hypothetical protein
MNFAEMTARAWLRFESFKKKDGTQCKFEKPQVRGPI